MMGRFGRLAHVISAAALRGRWGAAAGACLPSSASAAVGSIPSLPLALRGTGMARGYAKAPAPKRSASALATLTDTLEDELQQDQKSYKPLGPGDEDYDVPSGWKLVDVVGRRELIWKKQLESGVQITVVTDVTTDLEPKFGNDDMEGEDGDEEGDDSDPYDAEEQELMSDDDEDDARMHFTVNVERESGPNAGHLTFDCQYPDYVNGNARVGVVSVEFTPKEQVQDAEVEKGLSMYGGPNFDSVDIAVREGFEDYLASIGVTGELGAHVQAMAEDKEQREYQHWLKSVTGFFKK